MIPLYPLHSCWEERLGKLINLSFSYLSASAAEISPPSKAVSSDIEETPSHPQEEAPVGSPDPKQEIWTVRPLEAERGRSQEWVGVAGAAVLHSTECPIPSDHVSYKKHTLCVCDTRGSLTCKARVPRLVLLLSVTVSDSAVCSLPQWAYTSGRASGRGRVSEAEAASLKSLPVNISHCEIVWF